MTAEQISFITHFGRRLICVALPPDQIERLGLFLMVRSEAEREKFGTAFTYSVDAKDGVICEILNDL